MNSSLISTSKQFVYVFLVGSHFDFEFRDFNLNLVRVLIRF